MILYNIRGLFEICSSFGFVLFRLVSFGFVWVKRRSGERMKKEKNVAKTTLVVVGREGEKGKGGGRWRTRNVNTDLYIQQQRGKAIASCVRQIAKFMSYSVSHT